MATTFTHKLENFFDNNTPGGYIQTSINITDSELDARINQKFQNQNYLTSTSMIPASQITGLAEVATSGRYSDLIGITGTNVSISNTLTEGTRLATITINGVSTDIYGSSNGGNSGGDGIPSDSPAGSITWADITTWNNKSDFDGDYNSLNNLPDPSNFVFFIHESDILNFKNLTINTYCNTLDKYQNTEDSLMIEDILFSIFNSWYLYPNSTIKIQSATGSHIINGIIWENNIIDISLSPIYKSNLNEIDQTDKTSSEILDELNFNEFKKRLCFDVNNHILYIK